MIILGLEAVVGGLEAGVRPLEVSFRTIWNARGSTAEILRAFPLCWCTPLAGCAPEILTLLLLALVGGLDASVSGLEVLFSTMETIIV